MSVSQSSNVYGSLPTLLCLGKEGMHDHFVLGEDKLLPEVSAIFSPPYIHDACSACMSMVILGEIEEVVFGQYKSMGG